MTEPVPSRPRLLLQARRRALSLVAAVAGAAVALSWSTAVAVSVVTAGASPAGRAAALALALAGTVLAVLGVVAGMARRSTRDVEAIFRAEDSMMLAIAHEVRTPLSRLAVTVDEALDEVRQPPVQEPPDEPGPRTGAGRAEDLLDAAAAHVIALEELVADLLETARVMSGAMPVPREAVRLDHLVEDVVRRWSRPSTTFVCDLHPVVVDGSPRLLRRSVTNLVRNAERHAYAERPGRVELVVDEAGVAVLDRGPGVSDEKLELLLDDSPLSWGGEGAQLGLSLAWWIAEVHGGRLQLRNRLDQGFDARIVLPARATGEGDATDIDGPTSGGGAP